MEQPTHQPGPLRELFDVGLLCALTFLFVAAPYMALATYGPVAGLTASVLAGVVWAKLVPMTCLGGGSMLTSLLSILVVLNSFAGGFVSCVGLLLRLTGR